VNCNKKQFATLGQNIIPVAIEGTFDDCQLLVKTAFGDDEINKPMNLTSANSINVARWIPQSVYYYWAVAQMQAINKKKIAICVPSGNLGNLTSGILAMKTGLPVDHFVAASNQNDIVPNYLLSGLYEPKPSVQTIANAMDVGNPNNFPRLTELYQNNFTAIKKELSGSAYSDKEIEKLVADCYKTNKYLCDPHGATGYGAIKNFISKQPGYNGIFLETAHPCKFIEDVERIIGQKVELPQKLKEFAARTIQSHTLKADYKLFKAFLKETAKITSLLRKYKSV
jgi:threonine synthase